MTKTVEKQLMKVEYSAEVALKICELTAEGVTLADIAARDDMPSRATLYRWLSAYPKFFDAYERAKEISAQSLEEEALTMARHLKDANDFTGTKVQAYNYAMQQLRWSAARRDKVRYGQAIAPTNLSIPIQINTTLNLGQDGQPSATDNQSSVYTVEATINPNLPAIVEEEDESVLDLHASGEVVELEDQTGDNAKLPFGVPEHETQDIHKPKIGRPRKGPRKSPGHAARTAKLYAKKAARSAEEGE